MLERDRRRREHRRQAQKARRREWLAKNEEWAACRNHGLKPMVNGQTSEETGEWLYFIEANNPYVGNSSPVLLCIFCAERWLAPTANVRHP